MSGVFQVTQGVNTPTYLVFRPYVSMAEFDADSANLARARAALSAEELKKLDDLNQAAVLTSEVAIYAVSPKQSYMPAAYAADPFWKVNPCSPRRLRVRAPCRRGRRVALRRDE